MRSKYLLAAMALPFMFSCTQDEFDVQGIENSGNAVQNRVNAGKVAFVDGGDQADTRFDFGSGRWENGDKFRLFLMDEWGKGFSCGFGGQCNGEEDNANNTQFKEQQVWNNMYQVVDRFSSNFPFTYNLNNGAWENDDAIVEGNYFAVKPATGDANEDGKSQAKILDDVRNRRDVWVYINPVQKFANPEKNTVMTDGLDENQFFLGYTQVYRTDEATENNVLQLPMQMRPILAGIDLRIQNLDEVPFRVEKMVISRRDGKPMPTLAYVRPCNNTPEDYGMRQDDGEKYFAQQWNKVATSANLNDFVAENPDLGLNPDWSWDEAAWQTRGKYLEWGPAFAQPYIVNNRTDECNNPVSDYYWTIDSWTRTAARSVVYYSYPGEKGFTPYECTGELATPAYEYVIDFTDAEGNGVVLETNDFLRPYITLPHNMNMSEYTFTIYGQQWHSIDKLWREGIIIPGAALINDASVTDIVEEDGSFTLPTLDPSNEMDYIKAEIRFDDFKIGTSRVVQTTNASDLLNHLESYFGKMENGFDLANTRNEYFYVEALGDFEVTQPLVDYVQALNEAYGISVGGKALIYFTKTEGVNGTGRIIFPAGLTNDHAIDLFYFSKKAHIVNKGTQVIEKPMIYDYDQTIKEFYKALYASDWYKDGILHDGIDLYHKIEPAIANTLFGGIGSITNEGTLTLKQVVIDASPVGAAIKNEEGATLNMVNAVIVNGCEEEVDVHNKGIWNMTNSAIWGTLHNDNETNVLAGNNYIIELYNYNDCINCQEGYAQLTISEDALLTICEGSNGSKSGYLGYTLNYGIFSALNGYTNYPGSLIINGSEELAGNDCKVHMYGITNLSGRQEEAVLLAGGEYGAGIINWGALTMINYGYVYQADEYARILLAPMDIEDYHERGVIENTVHGNISTSVQGETPTKYQVIIYTVEEDEADIVDITNWLEKYHDYNKVVLKVGTLISGSYGTFDKLHFADEDGNAIEGEVEFALAETIIDGRELSDDSDEIVHLAVNYVKVDGTVRLMHDSELRVGQYDPNINCTVYGKGQIEVQNNCRLEGMGAADVLDCKVYTYGSGTIGAEFEEGSENIQAGQL